MKEEVRYWLTALLDESSIDETGQKANEILEDTDKFNKLLKLLDEDEELWVYIHRKIEKYMKGVI